MSILSQIFNVTFNVCISPNFSLPRPRVVKNVNFDPNFKRDWNFWILPNFILPRSKWSKISFLSQIFRYGSQILDFAKFHLLHIQSGQNSIIMFKFEWKGGIKMSKFKDNLGIDQSVTGELIKMLKFDWNMGNQTILVQNVKSIRMLKFGCKGGIH